MAEMITVKMASVAVDRTVGTVREWLRNGAPGVLTELRDGYWYVDLETLRVYANSRKKVARRVYRYKSMGELERTSCPGCGRPDWKREAGRKYTDNGDVGLSLYCPQKDCKKRWSVRLPHHADIRRNRRPAKSHVGQDSDEKIEADRLKFVKWMVDDGLGLDAISRVFNPNLRHKITEHFLQVKKEQESETQPQG
jgi:hypothetical protein